MSFKLHGNYCGPGWSAGRWQRSVISDLEPIDEFDETCKRHDEEYARGDDLYSADMEFAQENILSLSPFRVVSGIGVGVQGALRGVGILGNTSSDPTEYQYSAGYTLMHDPVHALTKNNYLRETTSTVGLSDDGLGIGSYKGPMPQDTGVPLPSTAINDGLNIFPRSPSIPIPTPTNPSPSIPATGIPQPVSWVQAPPDNPPNYLNYADFDIPWSRKRRRTYLNSREKRQKREQLYSKHQ